MSCHAEQREASSEKMDGEPACWPDFALLRMTALRCPAGSPPTKNKTAADCSAAVTESLLRVETSGDVFADQLGHVKHADLRLAREDNLQGGVRIDHAAVLFFLQAVLLDIGPQFLCELSAGHWGGANHRGER